jgi:hypothetical protein
MLKTDTPKNIGVVFTSSNTECTGLGNTTEKHNGKSKLSYGPLAQSVSAVPS